MRRRCTHHWGYSFGRCASLCAGRWVIRGTNDIYDYMQEMTIMPGHTRPDRLMHTVNIMLHVLHVTCYMCLLAAPAPCESAEEHHQLVRVFCQCLLHLLSTEDHTHTALNSLTAQHSTAQHE